MPQFILAHGCAQTEGEFNKRPAFVQGYVEALFFTEESPSLYTEEFEALIAAEKDIPEGSFPADCTPDDLSAEAWADIERDCEAFQKAAADALEKAYATGYTEEQAGRDFWFTRNGHGAGFWDRGELDFAVGHLMTLGERLTDAAKKFGEVYVTYGNGEIWL